MLRYTRVTKPVAMYIYFVGGWISLKLQRLEESSSSYGQQLSDKCVIYNYSSEGVQNQCVVTVATIKHFHAVTFMLRNT